ncbi:hypothetical protein [Saccharopolyspora sp. NPDC049357]|uniref:hypothetical protein n=1 Tax=Saccharopolyspora sp. NPDC049357 TaxID=3154507 RepID=UPI0034387C58
MARRRVVAGRRSAGRSAAPEGVRGRKRPLSKLWLGLGGTAGLLAIIAVVVAVFARPIESSWDDAKLRGPALLVEDVRRVANNGPDGWVWYFPHRLSDDQVKALAAEVHERGSVLNSNELMASAGGIRLGFEYGTTSAGRYHLSLVGNRTDPVRINDMRVKVVERKPPPTDGTLISILSQGGGPTDKVVADLDGQDNRVYTSKPAAFGEPERTSPFLDEHSRYAVTGEPLPFEVAATTTSCWCTWEIEVDVTSGDEKETVRVSADAAGAPLQTIYSGADLHYESEYQISLTNGEFINCALVAAGDPAEIARAAGGVYCPS